MIILDKQQVDDLDLEQCEATLDKIYKDKLLENTLTAQHPYWLQVDDIANTICYLEDRSFYLKQLINLERANAARWGRVVEQPQTPPPDEGFDH